MKATVRSISLRKSKEAIGAQVHRGHRYVGLLFEEIERLAKEEQVSEVYISTNHIGLYEKYGCEYLTIMNDMDGEPSRVYVKRMFRLKQ